MDERSRRRQGEHASREYTQPYGRAPYTGAQQRPGERMGGYAAPSAYPYAEAAPATAQTGRLPRKRGLLNAVFYLSIGIVIVCVAAIAIIVGMYLTGRQANSELQDTAQAPSVLDYASRTLGELTLDWDALRAINPDVVGWICMPGTMINYPVVQTTDNGTYLYKEFGGNYGALVKFGTIFVDATNSPYFTDSVNFMYGHNMNDGSMFAQIADLAKDDAFNEHRTLYLLTPEGNFRLKSFALCHVNENDPVVQTTFASNEAYRAYVQDKMDTSIAAPADTLPTAAQITKTFAFSTCDDTMTTSGRIILYCYVAESTSPYATGIEQGGSTAENDAAGKEMEGTADIVLQ